MNKKKKMIKDVLKFLLENETDVFCGVFRCSAKQLLLAVSPV